MTVENSLGATKSFTHLQFRRKPCNYIPMGVITIADLLVAVLYIMVLWLVASSITRNHIDEEPCYKYFTAGLFLKVVAGIIFALIYTFHYGITDTHYYYWGTRCMERLAHKDFGIFLRAFFGDRSLEVASAFDRFTGYPTYWKDPNSFAVCRFNIFFYLLGFKTFIGNTIVMNAVFYIAYWRFYKLMLKLFPNNERNFAIALLFVPSVVFWGSGLLKDGWCLVAMMFIFSAVHGIFIKRKRLLYNILVLAVWGYVCFNIRAYTFFTVVLASIIWVAFVYVNKMKSGMMRVLVFPIIALVAWLIGVGVFMHFGSMASSRYQSLDAIIETAVIIQDDLRKDYYGGNSFDIGEFDPTIGGMLSKAPQAIVAGVFRPFLWDVRNPLMLISALETTIIFILIIKLLLAMGIRRFFAVILRRPFLVAAFVLMLTYAFFVGITTANFGALVRYRMPVLVFLSLILAVEWRYMKVFQATQKEE